MRREKKRDTSRFWAFICISFILFLLLLVRLAFVQIVMGSKYKEYADGQRKSEIVLEPSRGIIYDTNMNLLTNSVKEKVCFVTKKILLNDELVFDYVKGVSGLSEDELKEIAIDAKSMVKVSIKNEVDIKKPKSIIVSQQVRRYDPNNLLTHVIGYIKRSTNEGISGIEMAQNELLTANKTYQTVKFKVDGKNCMIPGLGYETVEKSIGKIVNSVQLTIDRDIQKTVEGIMDRNKMDGAVIVADAKNGEILAMASRPNFDPTMVKVIDENDRMSFFNKAISVGYPPASLFKIVVLLTALEEDMVTFDELFECEGVQKVGNSEIKCHKYKDGGHGQITIEEAFYDSCNCAFIQLGKRIGAKKIMQTAKRLGLGQKVNIGLAREEIDGTLPRGDELLGPAIGNISIGQGLIEVTPLQITNMMLTIANDGVKKDMSLVKALVLDDGHVVKRVPKDDDVKIYDKKYSEILKKMLREVVTLGTAKNYISLDSAGKTGTAQATMNGKETNHSWFSGYNNSSNPEYVVTVLYENKSSGGKYGGSVFQEVINEIHKIYPQELEISRYRDFELSD